MAKLVVLAVVLVASPAWAQVDSDGGALDAGAPSELAADAGAVDAGEPMAIDAGSPQAIPDAGLATSPEAAVAAPPAGKPLPTEPSAVAAVEPSATASTELGGYAELTYNRPSDATPVLDVRRFVLFVGHTFDAHFRIYSELELEHAVSSADDQGEVEVEQAYAEYLHSDAFNVRAGLVLMPVGIINQFHEPPTFNGVDRPRVDTEIIPSTWREPGLGVYGRFLEDFRYQAYLVDGMRAVGFTSAGIREGHQEGQLALARSAAFVARLDYQPLNALDLGLSGYYGSANQGELPDGAGKLALGEADLRFDWRGLEARGEVALLHVSGAEQIPPAEPDAAPVGSTQYGLYVEGGYDLLHALAPASSQRLVVYGRYQRLDTQAHVPAGQTPDDAAELQIFEGGLTWRPIPELAVKGDVRRFSHPLASDLDATWVDLGLGWMF